MALMDILNAIGGGLSSAGRGIGKGFSVVGKTLADPFYESDEEILARLRGGADFGPTASAGLGGDYSPNFKKKKNFWDVLGDIGETTGRVATQVGRQLPILGPYVQAGEYGILKGIGKEDSDWAKGNIFAEREQAYEELQKQREYAEQERQNNLLKAPLELERTRTEIEADKSVIAETELKRQETQLNINKLLAAKRAAVMKYGSEENAEVAAIDYQLKEQEKNLLALDARIASENASRRMYETRGGENQPLNDVQKEAIARSYADGKAGDYALPGEWEKAYREKLDELNGKVINPPTGWLGGLNIPAANPLTATGQGAAGLPGQSPSGSTAAPNVSSVQGLGANSPAQPNAFADIDADMAQYGYGETLNRIRELFDSRQISFDEYSQYVKYLQSKKDRGVGALEFLDLKGR